MASSSSPGRPGQTGCGGAFLVAFGIVLVFVSIFAATFSDKPATTVQPVKKVSETQRNAFEPYAHEKPISIQLAAAAHHVRNTAELSLDVFESFAQDMEASLGGGVSYVDLWEKSDAVLELHRSCKLPEAARLSSSLVQLKDTVMHVEDGVRDINRAGWQAFSTIANLIDRVHDEIVGQRAAGVADSYQLHKMLTQLSTTSREKIDDLIARIDKTRTSTEMGLKVASEVRRDALAANNELRKRLENRSLARKLWEAGSLAVRTAEDHSNNVLSIQQATKDVQKHLQLLRGRLVDYAANAADFHSDLDAMEILPLHQELREIRQVGTKIQKVLAEARRTRRGTRDSGQARVGGN